MSIHLNPTSLRAAYEFLHLVAFDSDPRLPPAKSVRFITKKLPDHGYHNFVRGRHTIWVDTSDTKTWSLALQILAHEMIHLGRRDCMYGNDEAAAHDTLFRQYARAIETRMGWKRGSV